MVTEGSVLCRSSQEWSGGMQWSATGVRQVVVTPGSGARCRPGSIRSQVQPVIALGTGTSSSVMKVQEQAGVVIRQSPGWQGS